MLFSHFYIISQNKCGTTEHIKSLSTDYQQSIQKLDQAIAAIPTSRKKAVGLITIPVVFHIFHTGETIGTGSNVSQQLIEESMTLLNDAFRARDQYSSTTNDTEIQFALAIRDPNNQPTNGVNRLDASNVQGYTTQGYNSNIDGNEDIIKGMIEWDTKSYLNIWVVTNFYGRNIAGFATLPSFDFLPDNRTDDGITIEYSYINTIALTHEAGHYLGLYHTFDNSQTTECPSNNDCSTDGDKVCDTEPHYLLADCGDLSPTDVNTCTGNPFGNVLNNFMAYGTYGCKNVLTEGQATRMQSALEISYRKFLLDSKGLIAPTSPTANFTTSSNALCSGNVQFTDKTLDGPLTWEWTFEGGSPAISSEQHPIINYTTAGTHTVTLRTTNTLGSDEIRKEDFITTYEAVKPNACNLMATDANNNYRLGITKVEFKNVSFESGLTKEDHLNITSGAYIDNACTHIAVVELGEQITFNITVGTLNTENLSVYIDWNNDGVFNETDEKVAAFFRLNGEKVFTLDMPTTSNHLEKVLRVRIIDAFSSEQISACRAPDKSQVEDYGLVLTTRDCNNDLSGSAKIDDCEVCSGGNTGITVNETCTDCAGVLNGSASIDDCMICSGGTTGLISNEICTDCNNDVNGSATIDNCMACSGGNTGTEANSCEATGVTTVNNQLQTKLYPNPSKGHIHVQTNELPLSIEVFNMLGKIIETVNEPAEDLNLSHLKKGLYLINLKWKDHNETHSLMIFK